MAALGDPLSPPSRLHDEALQVTRRYPGDTGCLSKRTRTNAIELLSRFGRETAQLEVGQAARKRKRRQLREPRSRFALTGEIPIVLQLDLRGGDDVLRKIGVLPGSPQQVGEPHPRALRSGGHALWFAQPSAARRENLARLSRRDRRFARQLQDLLFRGKPPFGGGALHVGKEAELISERVESAQRIVLPQQEPE